MRLFVFLCVLLFTGAAQAQSGGVVDMRAYSRRHGFKPYIPRKEAPVRPVPAASVQNNRAAAGTSAPAREEYRNAISPAEKEMPPPAVKNDAQTDEISSYIKQNPHVLPDV